MDIIVNPIDPPSEQPVEIVERKGRGHPDTICDAIAEQVSTALHETYDQTLDAIPHYNTDQVQLAAGKTRTALGNGSLIEPATIRIVGRATTHVNDEHFNVNRIATQAAERHLRETLGDQADRLFDVQADLRPGSSELQSLTEGDIQSNDTSYGVGHYPLSQTEQTVQAVENALASSDNDALGTDIKIMGVRKHEHLDLTVAVAIKCHKVQTVADYERAVNHAQRIAERTAAEHFDGPIEIEVNAADEPEDGNLYLTVFGTSAEHGDDGSVGRGNRYNGLITPQRSMSLEAHSGKHKLSHVGRRYNELATEISERLVDQTNATEAQVSLVSEIGRPVSDPKLVFVEADGTDRETERVVTEQLQDWQH